MNNDLHLTGGRQVILGQGIEGQVANHMTPRAGVWFNGSNGLFADCGDVLDFRGVGRQMRLVDCRPTSRGLGMISKIYGASELATIRDVATNSAFDLAGHEMSRSALDELFGELPPTTRAATIDVSGNPGSATCDPSIATSKGYNVIT